MQRGSIREYVMLRQASVFFFFNAFFSWSILQKQCFFKKSAFFYNSHPSSFYLPLFSGRFRSRESVRPIRIKWREQIVVGPLMRENIGRCLLFGLFFIFSKIFLISFFFHDETGGGNTFFDDIALFASSFFFSFAFAFAFVCIFIFLFILSTFSFWFSCRS